MKKHIYFLVLAILTICFAACSKDEPQPVLPEISIENISGITSVGQKDTIRLQAVMDETTLENSIKWTVNGQAAGSDALFKFVSAETGTYTIALSCSNDDGETTVTTTLEVYPQFRHGTFVLNEGNMTSENGSLIFISPQGVIEDYVYRGVNGTELGNTSQDLFITKDKKMYIISQNGKTSAVGTEYDNEGKMVVANSETLVKIASYDNELAALSWPTHLGVLDDQNVFIRDNQGVYHFNTTTKVLTYVAGSSGASKNRMAVVNNKVFVPCGSKILVLQAGQTTVSETISIGATIRGVIKSSDGNLWVSTSNKIMKVSTSDYSVLKENSVSEGSIGSSFFASPGIAAIGDILYYSGGSRKIYRHDFNAGTSELLVNVPDYVENAGIKYNDIAVNPVTGEVYMNTIKAYGLDFLINNISVFNFSGSEPVLVNNYTDYTHFPAGIYFTYDFE